MCDTTDSAEARPDTAHSTHQLSHHTHHQSNYTQHPAASPASSCGTPCTAERTWDRCNASVAGKSDSRPSSSGSSRGNDRPSSGSSRGSDRPSSGKSAVSDQCRASGRSSQCIHSRTGSASSGDGLLLSVSALTRGGGRGPQDQAVVKSVSEADLAAAADRDDLQLAAALQGQESVGTELMGQVGGRTRGPLDDLRLGDMEALSGPPSTEREDPEGIDDAESPSGFSLLAVDKRVFGRLQEELTAAQSKLKLKEEEVTRLSRIRDDVEDELTELTASLFQEAHRMVREANVKAMHAEKALAEANMKVDGLMMEVAALKALVITSTPANPNIHLHPQLTRKKSGERGGGSAPGTPSKDRMVEGAEPEPKEKFIDPVLRSEFLEWKKSSSLDPLLPFFSRIYREDIDPCLEFPNRELGPRVREAVLNNTLSINPVKDDDDLPRNCSLFEQPLRCTHTLKMGDADTLSYYISPLARNRIASVCDFVTYCRYVTQGLVKVHYNEVYWNIMQRRRNMAVARLGFIDN